MSRAARDWDWTLSLSGYGKTDNIHRPGRNINGDAKRLGGIDFSSSQNLPLPDASPQITVPIHIQPCHSERRPHTMSFDSLPLEIKEPIWQLALHAAVDEPEVCIAWPMKTGGYDEISTPLLVDTAFPVLMHVCGQWRDFVLSFSQRPSSPIKFRFSGRADCHVPYRHFRPSTDIVYASAMNYQQAIVCRSRESKTGVPRATLAAVRHLAVDWPIWLGPGYWLPELVFRACPDLEKVSVVFPSSRRAIWSCFWAPATRCKLRRVERPDKLSAEQEWKPGEMVSVQRVLDEGLAHLEYESVWRWNNEVSERTNVGEPGGKWFVGSAWDKEREKFCFEHEAAAFVQYRRSEEGGETWVEACEDRLLEWLKCFRMPDSSPRLNAERLALDPEELRLNDEDGYQDCLNREL